MTITVSDEELLADSNVVVDDSELTSGVIEVSDEELLADSTVVADDSELTSEVIVASDEDLMGDSLSEGRDYRLSKRRVSKRTYPLQEAEIDGLGTNLMKTMAVVDQPRSAMVGAVIEVLEQDEFDLAAIKSEFEIGLTGKDHPMLGEYFESKIDHIKANPKDYPITSTILEGLDSAFNIPYKGYSYWANYEEKNTAIAGSLLALMTCGDDKECQKSRIENVITPLLTSAQQSIEKREKTGTATTALAYGVGFAGDVLLDPVTYTNPILKYTKLGLRVMIPDKVMNKMVETTGKTKQQIKTAFLSTNTGQKLSEASDFIWTLFSTKHDLKKLGMEGSQAYDIASKFKNLIAAARVKAVKDNLLLQKRIKQFSADTGVEVSEINKFITEAVERGGIPNVDTRNLSPATIKILAHNDDVRYEVWSLAAKNEAQLLAEINAGVKLTQMSKQPLFNTKGGETLYLMYMNHAIRPEALKAAKKVHILESGGKSASAFFNSKHSSTFKRRKDWAGLTINDVNDLAKKGTLPGYEGQVFKKGFFYDDPSILQALRDNKHYRSLAATELAGDIMGPQGFGLSPEMLIKLAKDAGWKASKTKKKLAPDEALKYLQEHNPQEWVNWAITENKYTRNWALPKDVAKFVDNNLLYLKNPQKVNMFLEQYDDLTRWWKSWTLSIFPSYHIRNAVGNTWNNFVVGVNPKTYKEALKFQQAIYRGETGSITIKGIFDKNVLTKSGVGRVHPTTKVSYTQIRDWADEYGVTGRGLFSSDIETTLRQEMGEGKWLTLSSKNKAIEIGKRVGEAVEDNARMANFIDGLKKGMTPEDAAKRVRRTLFDYSDLTDFEKNVMKRIFPFYTWTRKNVPFQIRQMIQHPGKYKAIDTLRQEVEAAVGKSDPNEKYISEWMLANYPTKVKVEDGKARYFLLGGWWAGADLWKLGSQPTKLVTDLLHPTLKIGLEMLTGELDDEGYVTDLFSGQKLHPEMQTDYFFGSTAETTKHYLNNIRVLSTLDEFIRAYYNEKGEGTKKLSPFVKEPKTIEEAFIAFFTGVRTFSVDLNEQKLFWLLDKDKDSKKYRKLYNQCIKKGRPTSECYNLIEKSIEPIVEVGKATRGFNQGGYINEAAINKQMQSLLQKN